MSSIIPLSSGARTIRVFLTIGVAVYVKTLIDIYLSEFQSRYHISDHRQQQIYGNFFGGGGRGNNNNHNDIDNNNDDGSTTGVMTTTATTRRERSDNDHHHDDDSLLDAAAASDTITDENITIPATEDDEVSWSPYAYAFIMGGVDPEHAGYRGFLYNILVATKLFRQVGTRADIVALVQLSYNTPYNTLPDEELRWLHESKIRVLYIPKSSKESFYDTMMNKFRILSLTEYRRVIFMDSDVIPNINLDYLFTMSDHQGRRSSSSRRSSSNNKEPILKENVVVAGMREPANGGFFMLKPEKNGWNDIQQIVAQRKATANQSTSFDEVLGWGHQIISPDNWSTKDPDNHGTNWTFLAAFADQGLLYHWVKYVKKDVSIIKDQKFVENWGVGPSNYDHNNNNKNDDSGIVKLEKVLHEPFRDYSHIYIRYSVNACMKFFCGYYHFTSKSKPWLMEPVRISKELDRAKSASNLWWNTLYQINNELRMKLNYDDWSAGLVKPLLGYHPTEKQIEQRVVFGEGIPKQSKTRQIFVSDHESFKTFQIAPSKTYLKPATNDDITVSSKYAYTYVINGVDPDNPTSYHGSLYNIMVSAKVLRDAGSRVDIVAIFQLKYQTSSDELPIQEIRWLHKMNVRVLYMPKTKYATYEKTWINRFCILSLTEYRRVIFLDQLVMPNDNLDYLFVMSDGDNPVLKENVVVAGLMQPASANLFMVAPKENDWVNIQKIVLDERAKRQSRSSSANNNKFDSISGFGHKIHPPDEWTTKNSELHGTEWNFHAANTDQGLLYHWVKYVKKSVSIVKWHHEVENWSSSSSGGDDDDGDVVHLEETLQRPFENVTNVLIVSDQACEKFMCGYIYFSGSSAPWIQEPDLKMKQSERRKSPKHFWWLTLFGIDKKLHMNINYATWKEGGRSLIGYKPKKGHRKQRQPILSELQTGSYVAQHMSNWTVPATKEDTTAKSPYAYAFIVGGCDPTKSGYQGFLYNILVAANLFRLVGSRADIVAIFQISYNAPVTTLTDEEIRLLHGMNVRVLYIPKSPIESFYDTMMNKFRILSLTEYRRVILMDADVIPNDNLDYLFALSDGEDPLLKENLVVAGVREPANGGFFMVEPKPGDYELLQHIVHKREVAARKIPKKTTTNGSMRFDIDNGWGHKIISPDEWTTKDPNTHGTKWDFLAAFADQGLLYHWVKYVKKSVSIVKYHSEVENWSSQPDGTVVLESKIKKPFDKYTNLLIYQETACQKFMCGYYHYTSKTKPWLREPMHGVKTKPSDRWKNPLFLWWSVFFDIEKELNMKIDYKNWHGSARPLLGYHPKEEEMDIRIEAAREKL